MSIPHRRLASAAASGLLTALLGGGCVGPPAAVPEPPGASAASATTPAAPDAAGGPTAHAAARARREDRPVAVLVVDAARGEADRSARSTFESAVAAPPIAIPVVLDLGESRNRAAAAPLHGLDEPTLVILSPGGMIVSHDAGPLSPEVVRQRLDAAVDDGRALDQQRDRLAAAAAASPADVAATMALADFLLACRNDREAIPYLRRVADDESAGLPVRVRAWTALGRAHLAVVEPEKARHAAQALMAALGPRTPEAIAGGNLVRGLQDAKAKRYDRAADELRTAVAAAPDSPYGKEAAELLARLPTP